MLKKRLMIGFLFGLFSALNVFGSESMLMSVYQPLFLSEGEDVLPAPVVCRVPLVASGPFPEICVTAICMPHPPLMSAYEKKVAQANGGSDEGDVNAASQAGITLECNVIDEHKFEIEWVFSKARPGRTNDALIRAMMECLEKTGGGKVVFFSKIVGGENFPEIREIILAKYPTKPVKKEEGEQGSAGQPATRSESDSEGGDKPQPESEGRSR
jgi:hypothetical protein